MSLESYKKNAESQGKRVGPKTINEKYAEGYGKISINKSYANNESPSLMDDNNLSNNSGLYTFTESESEPKSRNRKIWRLTFFILILSFFVLAAIKNPAKKESKIMVKDYIVEKINAKLREEMINEENDGLTQLGAFIGIGLTSKLIDYIAETSVNDYIIFSTFDCSTNMSDSTKTILSGIIVFGNIIPLHTDINPKKFNIKN